MSFRPNFRASVLDSNPHQRQQQQPPLWTRKDCVSSLFALLGHHYTTATQSSSYSQQLSRGVPSQVGQREPLYSHTPTPTQWTEMLLPLAENRSQSTSALYYQHILLSAATNHSSPTLANKLNQHCRYKFSLISS